MERTTAIIMTIITITVLAIVGSAMMKAAAGFSDPRQPSAIVSIFDDAANITNSNSTITFPK